VTLTGENDNPELIDILKTNVFSRMCGANDATDSPFINRI
jgi:hypothetical protein